MIHGSWLDCTITIATSTTQSAAVDLGRQYETLIVLIPTITSSTLACYGASTVGGTYYPLGNSVVIAASTGGYADIWEIGGFEFIKIVAGTAQEANRTFSVCGVRS